MALMQYSEVNMKVIETRRREDGGENYFVSFYSYLMNQTPL